MDTTTIGLVVLVALVGYAFYWVKREASKDQAASAQKLVDDAAQLFRDLDAHRAFGPVSPQRLLDEAADPFVAVCPAHLLEIKRTVSRVGIGTRVKIGNMPIYLGRSDPVVRQEVMATAGGELGLSGKRLVFSSPDRTLVYKLEKIVGVEIFSDSIAISIAGRVNPIYIAVGNGLLWGNLVKLLKQVTLEGRRIVGDVRITVE